MSASTGGDPPDTPENAETPEVPENVDLSDGAEKPVDDGAGGGDDTSVAGASEAGEGGAAEPTATQDPVSKPAGGGRRGCCGSGHTGTSTAKTTAWAALAVAVVALLGVVALAFGGAALNRGRHADHMSPNVPVPVPAPAPGPDTSPAPDNKSHRPGPDSPGDARRGGGRAFLGLGLVDSDGGAVVSAVVPGSPAADTVIEVGDRVVSVDGEKISSASQVFDAVRTKKPGDSMRIDVSDGSQSDTVEVTLGQAPARR